MRARERAARVLVDGEECRHTAAGLVDRAEQVAGALGRDHRTSTSRGGCDPLEPDVEAVGEHQQLARPQVGLDLGVVDLLLLGVRDEDHHDVGLLHGIGDVRDAQARRLRRCARLLEPGFSPTTTSTPDSWRLSAWAWPWLP